ncbi:hypothetical protein [Klebsiella variicola]|uniref:hypothetical protein n=1 Tax=Klebsiella variicola TaxID=244366 RepID=UPI003D967683
MVFFPLKGADEFSPLLKNSLRNLMLAEHLGLLIPGNPDYGTEAWREMVLLNRIIGQHANCVMRLELMNAKSGLACAKRGAAKDKKRSIPDERFFGQR